MASQQLVREEDQVGQENQEEAVQYGDVCCKVSEAMSAAKAILGQSPACGPTSLMQSAALVNVKAGVANPQKNDVTGRIRVTGSDVGDKFIVTQSIGDQVLGRYIQTKLMDEVDEDVPPSPSPSPVKGARAAGSEKEAITIGEALEAVILSAGEQPVERAEAAAIAAAEKRALGTTVPPNNGLGVQAHAAADFNAKASVHQQKATLDDVLQDASDKLPNDKAVTQEDAEEIVKAEIGHHPATTTTTGGIGEMMAIAAKVNHP